MNQTLAILLDAYRELNAKKLFWIVLILSGLVVLVFLAIGFGPRGVTVFGMQIGASFDADMLDRSLLYKTLFLTLGVNIWLTWAAAILALISTAGLFPDLLTSGSIDLFLSKPISRIRLFLTKYIAGLAFVLLQVLVFSLASFLVLGIRGGTWLPGVFLAVPIVLCFFSYLYCICVLIGVVTRSTIAAILLTILFWLLVLGVHVAETATLKSQIKSEIVAARYDRQIAQRQDELHKLDAQESTPFREEKKTFIRRKIDQIEQQKQPATDGLDWHRYLFALKTVLPKTSETVELMQRSLITSAELKRRRGGADIETSDDEDPKPIFFGMTTDDLAADKKLADALRARPLKWVLGTSLGFELVVLALAGWIFCRRDY